MRWPIFPLYEEGSTVWKELKIMQEMLASRGGGDFKNIAVKNFPLLNLVKDAHIDAARNCEKAEIEKWTLAREKWHCGLRLRTKKEITSAPSQGRCAATCGGQPFYYFDGNTNACNCFSSCAFPAGNGDKTKRFAYKAGGNVYKKKELVFVQRAFGGSDHEHVISLSRAERQMISNGQAVLVNTTVAAGHAHLLELIPRADDDTAED